MGLKEDLKIILSPFFGDEISTLIDTQYFDASQEEIITMAKSLLTKMLGEKVTNKKLAIIYKKYNIKVN
jgi:hypothetical protein